MTDCRREMLNQGAGQHDALVGLHGQLGQQLDGLPVVAHGEGLEAEHRLQLEPGARAGSVPAAAVLRPSFRRRP